MPGVEFRRARVSDAAGIQALINRFARSDLMLARPLVEIYETIRDFHVCTQDGRVVGCCALHVSWDDLGELRSLAVDEAHRGQGIARRLAHECLAGAAEVDLRRVFVLTYIPAFFARLGFAPIPKDDLPHKVWSDCTRCPKFPNCDEEALIRAIEQSEGDR
jgi:amino-acid N-acetyltransferase